MSKLKKIAVLNKSLLAALCVSLPLVNVHAEDLGRYGATFNVVEQDGEVQLKNAVRQKLSNGGQEKLLKGAQQRAVAYYSNLPPLQNIRPVAESRVRTENLSVSVPKNIIDDKGKVVVAAGTVINPLAIRPLSKKVFFIDGRDRRQLDLVKTRAAPQDKIILTAGNLFDVRQYLKRDVFIDQNPIGPLANRMKIHVVPSIASQSGVLLKIEEIKP